VQASANSLVSNSMDFSGILLYLHEKHCLYRVIRAANALTCQRRYGV
jgi:hypothetical protein